MMMISSRRTIISLFLWITIQQFVSCSNDHKSTQCDSFSDDDCPAATVICSNKEDDDDNYFCANGGKCGSYIVGGWHYVGCHCPEGYTGAHCQYEGGMVSTTEALVLDISNDFYTKDVPPRRANSPYDHHRPTLTILDNNNDDKKKQKSNEEPIVELKMSKIEEDDNTKETSSRLPFVYMEGRAPKDATYVIIHESVQIIEDFAFSRLKFLVQVDIPPQSQLQSIGLSAFRHAKSLRDIGTIPASAIDIGERAFEGCTALSSINVSNTTTKIGKRAFVGCKSLDKYPHGYTHENGRGLVSEEGE